MSRTSLDHHNCSFARTVDLIGDRWSLMILRDAFYGVRRFSAFKERLGITQAVLSSRLQDLVKHGFLEKGPGQHEAGHDEYRLTAQGRDLFPVVVALMQWGDKWLHGETGPPILVGLKGSGEPIDPMHVTVRGQGVSPAELDFAPGPGATAATLAEFQSIAANRRKKDQGRA
ncbi:MAG: helix-turn-helix transcriptional regulator [Rhodocyclaceae bacterium]|jgi:DNA-binding HxlR family transcriptional regulator|nr:helix-turn-helix transcriptional regulator [Rhodocyclaceae bacterium]MCA3160315.1 helix-turn-helix transcriptional regulator [Burkholderiales bacterium]MCA3592702.1 helix-turn-helix transcriptional regulator [Methylocystis sp.]MCA3653706.1 helix-turn-helix transcriptional regulator [Methylobacterium sp.]